MSNAEARNLLQQSGQFPEEFGIEMKVEKGSRELMSARGVFNNATQTTYMDFVIDPALLNDTEGGEMGAEMFTGGFTIYASPQGSVWLINGTAYAFPPSNETDDDSPGFAPNPEETPFGEFFSPDGFTGAFSEEDVNVTSVTPVVYRGQPAVRIVATGVEEGQPVEATIVVFTNSKRIAHIETVLPTDPENPGDPMAGALATLDFYYEGELELEVPRNVQRSLGLAYKSNANPFSWGEDDGPTVWTFLVDGNIALNEVEIQVKGEPVSDDAGEEQPCEVEDDWDGDGDVDADDQAAAEEFGYCDYQDSGSGSGDMGGDMADFGAMPTLWSMKLSDGTKTQDGVTLAFDDVDGDGKVSQGDTLTITTADGEPEPTLVLYDTVTGTYVVPGPALLALLAGLGAAALVLRRRA